MMSYRMKEKHENKIYNGSVDHRGQNSKNESYRRKSPLRVQNDWSEHVSSKGLIYYYNSKTEVSQWQRPTEWTLPQMTSEEIKRCLNRSKNGESNNLKRSSTSFADGYSKRPKYNNNNEYCNNRKTYYPVINKEEEEVKVVPKTQIVNKNCKFNDDDMDISPGSSPLSGHSNISECDNNKVEKICDTNKKMSTTELTPYQITLINSLRTVLQSIKSLNSSCLSVYQISDLLMRLDNVSHNGDTFNTYRCHRLQAQMSADSNGSDKSSIVVKSQPANPSQIKEAVKTMQKFIQEQYPNIYNPYLSYPVSPTYTKSNKLPQYTQILSSLIETCLNQLCPQSLNSPSSTSSPGSLKDNSSNISVSTSVASVPYTDAQNKHELESPLKKEKIEEKPKSVLQDPNMLKYISADVTNTYRNQLADCYEKEAQSEYYKFVKLHSVLYSDLACESKKLKALVRISEIKTELLKQKKDDLEKIIQTLDSKRLPSHLKCDYIPNS